MPPSSIETRSSCSADCSTSFLPTSVEPGEGQLAQPRVADERLAHRAGVRRGDDVEHAVGQPALLQHLGQQQHGQRGLLGRLDDHGAAGGDRGPILRVPMASGKFHGVIISVGPTGCFMVISRVAPLGAAE